LYRDIRTYGLLDKVYRRALEAGVLFFRYEPGGKPAVEPCGDRVRVIFDDLLVHRRFRVDADLLCLAGGAEPRDSEALARLFKVPVDQDGWLLEAHQKLRPVDFSNDGVFVCGMAHYPKPIDESIAQAQAAAARALTLLARDSIQVGGIVAHVQAERCSGCGGCVDVCPFGAIALNADTNAAEVKPALCKGCGACAAACPSEAPVLMGFDNEELYAQIRSAMAG
jgi:heterodisulfide reductase subunit A